MNSAPAAGSSHFLQAINREDETVEFRRRRTTCDRSQRFAANRRSISLEDIPDIQEQSRITKSLKRIKMSTISRVNVRDIFSSNNLPSSSHMSKSALLICGATLDTTNLTNMNKDNIMR